MWRTLLVVVLLAYLKGMNGSNQELGEIWKSGASDDTDDTDFVRQNESHLEGIPKFLRQPNSLYYVYENKPVRISCIAEPVSHVNIICNKIVFPYMDQEVSESKLKVKKRNKENKIDEHGERWSFSLEVSYSQVAEWFNSFTCVCEAWNQIPSLRQAKKIHSIRSTFKEAFFKDTFKNSPQSKTIQKGQRLSLSCVPPDGKPDPSLQWLKDGKKIADPSRMKVVDQYQLEIDTSEVSDSGNYSCLATSLNETRHSEIAIIKVQDGIWTAWSGWSKCNDSCKRLRKRSCYQGNNCKGVMEEVEQCAGTCEYNKAVTPFLKNYHKNGVSPSNFQEVRDIAMYVGLFVAVSVLVMVVTVIFCLVRKKALLPLRSSSKYPNDMNGKRDHSAKSNLMQNSRVVMKSQTVVALKQPSLKPPSPYNYPPPSFSDMSSNNAFPTSIDAAYNTMESGHFSQPLISNSSSISTSNKSRTTNPSNNDFRVEPLIRPETPLSSSPPSAHYQELLHDQEFTENSQTLVSDNLDISTLTYGTISSDGGRLCLPQSGISLTINDGSFTSSSSNEMYLAVSRNDPNPPTLTDSETLLSPIVLFGPSNVHILKPCVLSIPHSADLKQGNWVIRLMSYSSSSQEDLFCENPSTPTWKNVATIGCETDNTSIYTHLDPFSAHILTEQCQKLCLVGQSYPGGKATKRLRLAAFGRPLSLNPYLPNYNIRIYVFSDTKEAFENVSTIELNLGSTLLDNTHQIIFSDGLGNLFFCVEELSTGWRSQLAAKYQEIPFKDIWSGSQSETLHCAFTFDSIDASQSSIMCRITAYQSGFYNHKQTISIKQDRLDRGVLKKDLIQHEKILLHTETNNTYLDPLMTVFRISVPIKKRLCRFLDNINSRGNDWRQLSRQLNLNGYTNYFSNKISPTDAILTLWEARNRSETATSDLINSFKSMGRSDCASLLEFGCT